MKKKTHLGKFLFPFLFCIMATLSAWSQSASYLDGVVTTGTSNQPVPNCSVYFNSTSKGDVTGSDGSFHLNNAPQGRYELIISAIGYETTVIPVTSDQYPYHLKVNLKMKASDLSAVTIEPFLANGWEKYGSVFFDNFVGSTPNASWCRIVNPAVLKFWFSERTNKLTARADEPLVITNKALGYTIKYKMEQFVVDFGNSSSIYIGYPFFEEMTPVDADEKKKWEKSRRQAYYGSVMHFMRTLHSDLWQEDGFHIITKATQPNLEKQRVSRIHFNDNRKSDTFRMNTNGKLIPEKPMTYPNDSIRYYKKILKQPDFFTLYLSLNDLDSLLTTNGNGSKTLFFHDKLKILYQPKPTDKLLQSEIWLLTPEPIIIDKSGGYFSPRELFMTERWAKYEKMANALPLDYNPDR
ncbi:MAG: carboxypeptidase-like regulatory domain-containing protein [Puia sp.]|nr:carboxypeptidase-like regulatory domain-containing protein [Puia sp.]